MSLAGNYRNGTENAHAVQTLTAIQMLDYTARKAELKTGRGRFWVSHMHVAGDVLRK